MEKVSEATKREFVRLLNDVIARDKAKLEDSERNYENTQRYLELVKCVYQAFPREQQCIIEADSIDDKETSHSVRVRELKGGTLFLMGDGGIMREDLRKMLELSDFIEVDKDTTPYVEFTVAELWKTQDE